MGVGGVGRRGACQQIRVPWVWLMCRFGSLLTWGVCDSGTGSWVGGWVGADPPPYWMVGSCHCCRRFGRSVTLPSAASPPGLSVQEGLLAPLPGLQAVLELSVGGGLGRLPLVGSPLPLQLWAMGASCWRFLWHCQCCCCQWPTQGMLLMLVRCCSSVAAGLLLLVVVCCCCSTPTPLLPPPPHHP